MVIVNTRDITYEQVVGNIMDTYQVRFCETTQERYDELTKEPGTLYFTSDTKRLYKGNQLFASELTEVYDNNSKFLGYAIAGQTDKPLVPASLLPAASDDDPKIAGTKDSGTSGDYSRADHVHPAETDVEYSYSLPSNLLPITFKYGGASMSADSVLKIEVYDNDKLALYPPSFPAIAVFDKQTGVFLSTSDPAITDMAFGGTPSDSGVWPILNISTTIQVRGESVQLPLSPTQLANIEDVPNKIDKLENPTNGNLVCVDSTGELYDSGLNAAKVDERISTMRQACEVLWWDDPSKYAGKATGAGRIFFRPREVGMWDNGCLTVINFHTGPD